MAQEYQVFGPPGTGKTTFVSRWINEAAEKYNPKDIIVSSLTRTAAAELAGRKLPIPKESIGTLHSHCFRLLGDPKIAESKEVIREWNKVCPTYALSETGADIDECAEQSFTAPGDELLNQANIYRMQMRDRVSWKRAVNTFFDKWTEFKNANGLYDFTDLISVCEWTGIAPAARIGFFDEVQDFTPLELSLIRGWSENMDYIVMSGDDDQCIYSFAGATPDAFLGADVPAENKRVLSQSYRVPGAVWELSQQWVNKLSLREPKTYKPRDYEGEVLHCAATFNAPQSAIEAAECYLSAGKSVMFLASCSYMLTGIVKTLREAGIPFHNPYRRKRGDWNPLHIGNGVSGKDRLLAYLRSPMDWTYDEVFRWASVLRGNGNPVIRGAMKILERWKGVGEPFSLHMLSNILAGDECECALNQDVPWYLAHLNEQGAKSLAYPYEIYKRHGEESLKGEPRVTVGTIHSVKGGEADVVFLFPDLSMLGAKEWASASTRDAVVRQFYVAMTRARESLILCQRSGPRAVDL